MIFLAILLFWWMFVASLWLCWAFIALLAMLVYSATGNKRAVRSLPRSLNWHRVFDPF